MRARTPLTGAEREIEARSYLLQARVRGRNPERTGQFGPLVWDADSVLPPDHPLADTPSEARAKRLAQERARRAPLRERDPWWG